MEREGLEGRVEQGCLPWSVTVGSYQGVRREGLVQPLTFHDISAHGEIDVEGGKTILLVEETHTCGGNDSWLWFYMS